jgi:hypothetical protein
MKCPYGTAEATQAFARPRAINSKRTPQSEAPHRLKSRSRPYFAAARVAAVISSRIASIPRVIPHFGKCFFNFARFEI